MTTLPEQIISVDYLASNGELAWRREDLPAALSAIAKSGQAILGGEVWVIFGGGVWSGLVPDRNGGPPGDWHWETSPQRVGEAWSAYCLLTAEESARLVDKLRVEEESDPAVLARLYFNLTFIAETGDERGGR